MNKLTYISTELFSSVMTVISQKLSKLANFYANFAFIFVLPRKSIVLLYESKSWTVLGVRILNRLYSGKESVPAYMKWIFPKANAWVAVAVAVGKDSNEQLLQAIQHLISFKNVYYDYSLIEFNLDYILKKVEEKNPYGFKLLYQKKINDFLKDSAQYEIHNSFFLKKTPRLNFHIDSKRFLFLLPIKYLFKTDEHKQKQPDFLHTFNLPSRINESNNQKYSSVVEGDKVWELQNVKLIRGYQLLNEANYISYEKAADPIHKFVAGYYDSAPSYRLIEESPYAKVNVSKYKFQDLENIFLVSGRCSRNYFHWLIEYLPKILWFVRQNSETYKDCKIAVDSLMPTQHYQALQYIIKKISITNPVIKINPDENIYNVKNIFVCSNPTFIPDSFEDFNFAECSVLNLETLAEYRKLFISGLSNKHERKIYLARHTYSSRRLVNEQAVMELFIKYGFEIVYPEQYTFEEQLNLFNSAKYIAGASGAAFSNLIFCQENTVVINFLAYEIKDFSVFSNLCTLSNSHYYVETGRLIKSKISFTDKISWLYSDFKIDVGSLEEKLQRLLPPR